MRVGLFLTTEFDGAADPAHELADMLDQVRAARDAGFESIWIPQHFVTGPGIAQFQTMPMLARVTGEAPGMVLGTSVLLLPMLNPVLLAEEAASIDWMCDGKLVLGLGMGYRDHEFMAMGTQRRERVGRFVEYVEAMRLLMRQDRVTYAGRYVTLEETGISLKPKQAGGVPFWLGGTVEPAIRRAARLGDAWMSPAGLTVEAVAANLEIFADERRRYGLPLDYPRQISGECHVGATRESAIAEAGGPLMAKYARYASFGYAGGGDTDFDSFSAGRFFVGDEPFVRDMIQRYRDDLGADRFRFRMRWPGLGQKEVLKSIERLGRVAASC